MLLRSLAYRHDATDLAGDAGWVGLAKERPMAYVGTRLRRIFAIDS